MSSASLRGALLVALASLALCAPAAVARPADLRSEAPTSSLSGTTDQPSAEAIPGRVLRRSFDPYPEPVSRRETAALAQERAYSTYGEPAPQRAAATTAATDSGDGIAWVPFVLALFAALVVGLGAGSGLQARRHATRPAT
jgi:hypothetical protein